MDAPPPASPKTKVITHLRGGQQAGTNDIPAFRLLSFSQTRTSPAQLFPASAAISSRRVIKDIVIATMAKDASGR